MELDQHFIRDRILQNHLFIEHVSSCYQITSILTKPSSSTQFHSFKIKLIVLPKLLV